jgi:hypothetical protein
MQKSSLALNSNQRWLWLNWALAAALGTALGSLAQFGFSWLYNWAPINTFLLSLAPNGAPALDALFSTFGLIANNLIVAGAGWLVIRPYLRYDRAWLWAAFMGLWITLTNGLLGNYMNQTTSQALGLFFSALMSWLTFIAAAVVTWLALRLEVKRASRWLLWSAVGYALAIGTYTVLVSVALNDTAGSLYALLSSQEMTTSLGLQALLAFIPAIFTGLGLALMLAHDDAAAEKPLPNPSNQFLLKWALYTLVSVVAWRFVSILIALTGLNTLISGSQFILAIYYGVYFAWLALFQWLMLRQWIRNSWIWLLATFLGGALGVLLTNALDLQTWMTTSTLAAAIPQEILYPLLSYGIPWSFIAILQAVCLVLWVGWTGLTWILWALLAFVLYYVFGGWGVYALATALVLWVLLAGILRHPILALKTDADLKPSQLKEATLTLQDRVAEFFEKKIRLNPARDTLEASAVDSVGLTDSLGVLTAVGDVKLYILRTADDVLPDEPDVVSDQILGGEWVEEDAAVMVTLDNTFLDALSQAVNDSRVVCLTVDDERIVTCPVELTENPVELRLVGFADAEQARWVTVLCNNDPLPAPFMQIYPEDQENDLDEEIEEEIEDEIEEAVEDKHDKDPDNANEQV